MKKKIIYITESQLDVLRNSNLNEEEITFFEFFSHTKSFLKDLLTKPADAKVSDLLTKKGITRDNLLSKMKDYGLIKSSERVDEIPVEEGSDKKVAKHYIQYKIPRQNFKAKMQELYKDLFEKESLQEDGAASCGSVMQDGGTNPDAGQFITPVSPVQRRSFWKPALKRNKDEKNGSISMNRQK